MCCVQRLAEISGIGTERSDLVEAQQLVLPKLDSSDPLLKFCTHIKVLHTKLEGIWIADDVIPN
jgi:hypothetical protein